MRILLLIGAALMAAAIGGLANVMLRDRGTSQEAAAPAAAEPVVTRDVRGTSFRVPLPVGHCALDPANPADRALLDQVASIPRRQSADLVTVSLPCGQRQAVTHADKLPPNVRLVALAAVRPGDRVPAPATMTRAVVLDRMRERMGSLDRAGIGSAAGDDENAVYLRVSETSIPGGRFCGAMAFTMVQRSIGLLLVIESCDSASIDTEILPQTRRLAARLVALNP